jgi:hypothetical protein
MDVNAQRIANGHPAILRLCADSELNHAATAEGLAVDNPNSLP